MAYTKYHDPWISGSSCCTSAPGAQVWSADAANYFEQGLFDAAAIADAAQATANAAIPSAGLTRRSAYAVGLAGGGAANTTGVNGVHWRNIIKLPADTTRWRLHFRNWDSQAQVAGAGTVNMTQGMYVGVAPGGVPLSLTQAVAAFSVTGGTEYVSPWVTASNLQFKAGTQTAITFGGSFSGATVKMGYGGARATATATDAAVLSPAGMATSNLSYLDIWIEYEAQTLAPTVLVLGDSITQAYNSSASQYDRAVQSWPNLVGCRSGMLVCNAAVAGNTFLSYPTTSDLFSRWSSANGFSWDAVVIALGSNDINASASLGTLQSRLYQLCNDLRDNMAPKRIHATTVLARAFGGNATMQGIRASYNTMLIENTPYNVAYGHDTYTKTVSAGDPNALLSTIALADGIHINNLGEAMVAQVISSRL